jgi:transposase-like protein
VGKRRVGQYPLAFRQQAVERMKVCQNVHELAAELGVHRTMLYRWRDQLAPQDRAERQSDAAARELILQQENRLLKQALADKTLELDFFKGALQKVAARRQSNKAGETVSSTKSGS